MNESQGVHGLLVFDKPSGWTSRDVVNRTSRVVGRRVPVGHAGTLDPLATGVLVVCLGDATRLVPYVQRMPKTYDAIVVLGADSATDDNEGPVIARNESRIPSEAEVREALKAQVGWLEQIPPRFSAVHVDGKRAYRKARAGDAFALEPRRVRVDEIALRRYEWPGLAISVTCGAGTYIRAIARDVGVALECGGYLGGLIRTAIGPFRKEVGLDPRDLDQDRLTAARRPCLAAVPDLPRLTVSETDALCVARGQAVAMCEESPMTEGDGEVALVDGQGRLLALAVYSGTKQWVQPRKVFCSA